MAGRIGEYDYENPYAAGQYDYIGGGKAPAAGFAAAAAPWLGPVGLGLQGLGLASSLYGSYKQGEQAKREHALAVKRYEAEMQRQKLEDERIARLEAMKVQQQGFDQALASGTYAQNLGNNAMDRYGSYARSIGI